ncbi:toll-like receptor 4 [Mytilus edulis]|uniref:toll-like receptor 4 n=1 Tax=Mytilus edulis TaxID=6550 RepID=UPI0039EEE83A
MKYIVLLFLFVSFKCSLANHCKITRTKTDITCDCSSKNLRRIPLRKIPRETTILNLSGNSLTLVTNNSFEGLGKVHTLYLQSSKITLFEVGAFSGLDSLTYIDLSSNFIEKKSLPPGLFRPISKLQYLNIASNLFLISKEYPDRVLQDLTHLQNLSMSGINGAVFGNGFKYLTSLNSLNLDPCSINELQNDTFVSFKGLPILNLNFICRLKKVQPGALAPFQSISSLAIVGSELIRISDLLVVLSSLRDRNMSLIDFSSNYRSLTGADVISSEAFSYLGGVCVKEVILRRNQIGIIKGGSISRMKYKNCLQKFDVSQNNIYGDYQTGLEIFKLSALKVLDCSKQEELGPYKKIKNESLNFEDSKYSLSYSVDLPPSLERLNASGLSLKNSPLANVNFKFASHVVYFDVNWTPFTNCDGVITGLDNLQFFGMSGFNCEILNPKMISSFKNLQELQSRNANLNIGLQHDVNEIFLKGLKKLRIIDFAGNGLENLNPKLLRSQYNSLYSVDLSNNNFDDFPFQITEFKNLSYINLENNKIIGLDEKVTNDLDDLESRVKGHLKIRLYRNLLQCNCKSLNFIKWLFKTKIQLDNGGNYSCGYIDGSKKSTAYALKNIEELTKQCASKFWLITSVCLTLLLIIIIFISSIVYKYRITLQYWYLVIRRRYKIYSKLDEQSDYKYSAFVAYHNDNYSWVCGPLTSFLEGEKKLSLCLHDRDFALGSLIVDNIFEAISQSKKVILIVSKSFLKSTWCEYELDMARMRMFRENKDILIVILVEKIPPEDMPKSLLRIWNNVTCIEAEEYVSEENTQQFQHLFWKRLYQSIIT